MVWGSSCDRPRILYAVAVVKKVLLFVMVAWIGASAVAQGGSALNPECHKLYEMFNLPDLTYEDVGKIADKMHENKCWPVLQGIEITPATSKPTAPAATDCKSLADLIVQMGREQSGVVRLYGIKPLDRGTCGKSFFKDNEGRLNFLGRYMPDENIYKACGPVMGASTDALFPNVRDGPTLILKCVGMARYASGQSGDELSLFYLERFPDGEEYWGIKRF